MSAKKPELAKAFYLVCGEDDFLGVTKAREIIEAIMPAEEQLTGLEVIDGGANNAAEVEESVTKCKAALSSGGLFSTKRLVWLRGVTYAGTGRTAESETAKTAVASLTAFLKQGLDPDCCFLVTAGKIDKRSVFYKFFDANGTVFVYGGGKAYEAEKDAAGFLNHKLREMGLRMQGRASEVFLQKVGSSSRFIVSELEKLALYAGGRTEITIEDVSAITSSARVSMAWDIADAFAEKDLVRALIILRRLLYQNENEVGIIMALNGRIRDLMIYREALDNGWICQGRKGGGWYEWGDVSEQAEVAFSAGGIKDPRQGHPYRVNLIAVQAARFSMAELKAMLSLTIKAHERLVTTSDSKQNVLETLLVRILRKRRKSVR